MGWHSKGFQVRKNKGVENSPPKTRRPRKTFILERIITPSALVPGGVDDRDALHQLLNSLSLLNFDFSDWAEKLNHATNLHLFADSGAGTCPTSPTPDGDLPPIVDFDPLGLHSPPTPTPGPNVQGAFDTLPPPIILPVDPPESNNKVPTDLGGAYTFTAKTTSGNNDAGKANQYTFSIASSELNSTDSDTVVVGISVESKDGSQGLPQLPEVDGLTPILTSSDTNSTYSLFSINRSGLNLLNLNGASSSTSGAYSLQLNVAGDINSDGRVDATDRQLLDNALGRTASDPGYTIDLDLNRDGIINGADQTLFNTNFGFIANRPPVASPFSTSTHTELETTIPLVGKATDPEGDSILYKALNPVNGTVLFDSNTKTATFKPAPGFSGIASFELAASDGLNWGVPAKVTVNVSGAPLLSLDFAERRPQLYAGDSTQLRVLGDFADQKGVVLPASYLTYASLNPGVAPIDAFGKVTGLADGTSILSASRNNIQAVTAARVGELPIAAANDDEWKALLAEIYGLDVYPKAVTLTTGVKRSLLVGIEGFTDSPDLKFGSVGTRYFVSNPNILQVNSDGVITALGEGVASVTVIDGGAEKVVPVRVKTPLMGPAIVGVDGGVVQGSDGSVVMVAPSALTQDTTVNITPLSSASLPLPFPDSMEFAGGFNLDLGNTPLNIPVQLAIPAPVGVPVGTEVLFMRKGSLPAGADSWNETWLIQESGVVGADGMIRTTSPPFPGVTESGTYTIGLLPAGMPSVSSIVNAGTKANAGLIKLSTNLNFENSYLGGQTGGVGAVSATENQFEATTSLLAYLAQSSNKPLEMIGIPKVGEPAVTTAQVGLNAEGVPTVSAVLNGPDTGLAVPLEPPSLESAELKFSNSEPVIFLTGNNFLNGLNGNLGSSFGDLKVDFWMGGKNYSGTVVPELSSSLGENRYKVAVKAPINIPLGESEIVLSRPQKEHFGPGPLDSGVVERSSVEDIQLKPIFSDLILVAQRNTDKIQVIDALSSGTTPPNPQQQPPENVSVGIPGTTGKDWDRPGQLAVTSNATRAYVPLESTGRVAMVDLLARREVDIDASTATVDDIILPLGASPGAISIDPWDNYAYVTDSKLGSIYVLDINPDSASYNQVVQTISVEGTSGLRQIAISSDGRKLFATAKDGNIYAVNIDPEDQPTVPNSNPRKWWEQIGKVSTPTGAWGLAATPDPLKMVFTNGNPNTDGSGFGVLTVSDDPINWAPKTDYTSLTLGSGFDFFDVTEGVAVTVTADGNYAFVAGRNSKKIIEGDNPLAGGNIGIIQDPLGLNPKLVAATQQMPELATNNLALSSDGKYLIGSYPTLGGKGDAYVFDVEEIIKTVENPGGYDLTKVGVDKINPKVVSNSFAITSNPLGLAVAKKPHTNVYGASVYGGSGEDIIAQSGFKPTGLAPTTPRRNADKEEQRNRAINIVKQYADTISSNARKYNVAPEAIAGAILWEGLENPYDPFRRPGFTRSNIPGKVHPDSSIFGEECVAEVVENERLVPFPKIRQEVVIFPPVGALQDPSFLAPIARRNLINSDRAKRLKEPATAIMYIAAIMDHHAKNYEKLDQYPKLKAAGYDIRQDVGVLCQLYQAGNSQKSASGFQTRFIADPKARPIVGDEMGKWVRNNINFIRILLGM
ncbi:Ig-like domain-containing protein [Microcoleus sp. C2C3]|uniref:Ig-like domain-containing protein n=1 Tax=unclassified Microcoleus TaxID=2642155 RepID=UPI002FD08753